MKQNTINMPNMASLSAVRRGDLKNAVIASTPGGVVGLVWQRDGGQHHEC